MGGFLLESREDVAVGVEGQADLRVAERLHDNPGVDPLDEQQRSAGVAEIVNPDVRQFRGPQDSFERSPHVAVVQRRPGWSW